MNRRAFLPRGWRSFQEYGKRHVAPAIRRHMLDFLAAIQSRGKPVADIEEGHISTASCILGAIIQDPRIIKIGEWFYVTYACRHFPFGQFWIPGGRDPYLTPPCPPEFPRYLRTNATLTGLAMTRDFKSWIRAGWLTDPLLDDRDVILFPERVGGKFVMMHRPLEWVGEKYGTDEPCAWISLADDMLGFPRAGSRLLIKNKYPWESAKLGINTPPIKTPHGWLTIYHAVGTDRFYRLGALLLDLDDPGRVLHRTPDWLMEPEADYEIEGFYLISP